MDGSHRVAARETRGATISAPAQAMRPSRPEAVLWPGWHARTGDMSKSRSNGGTIDVDGATYDWHLQREPHQSDDEGWKGMTIALLQHDAKREAWVEFPPPKRLLKGLPRGRLQLDDATIARCVRAAMSAGWEPMSRGKPMVFTVDAEGN